MLSQDTSSDLLRHLIEELRQNNAIQYLLIEEVRRNSTIQVRLLEVIQQHSQHSAIQNKQPLENDSRLGELEKKCKEITQILYTQQAQLEECQESADFAVKEVRHLTHLVGEKEALEERVAFYCQPD